MKTVERRLASANTSDQGSGHGSGSATDRSASRKRTFTRLLFKEEPKPAAAPNEDADRPAEARYQTPSDGADEAAMPTSKVGEWGAVSRLTLRFEKVSQEDGYQKFYFSDNTNVNTVEQALLIFVHIFILATVAKIAIRNRLDIPGPNTAVLRVELYTLLAYYVTIGLMFLWTILHFRRRREIARWASVPGTVFTLAAVWVMGITAYSGSTIWCYKHEYGVIECHEPDLAFMAFLLLPFHLHIGVMFQYLLYVDVLIIMILLLQTAVDCADTPPADHALVAIPFIFAFYLLAAYYREKADRATWSLAEEQRVTEHRSTQLLNDLLPPQVLEEFQQDKLKLAYTHEKMTFLFADIVGFTSFANSVDATEVVRTLQSLFARFDADSTRFSLYKLCTIGDAYVTVTEPSTPGNVNVSPVEGAESVMKMARAMIDNIVDVRTRLGIPALSMRIGCHFGRCVGGVIGSGRLRFDIWGMDVLAANMMESNGEPGRIAVSRALKRLLERYYFGRYRFSFHKNVEVINTVVEAYLVALEEEGVEQQEDASAGAARRKRLRRLSVLVRQGDEEGRALTRRRSSLGQALMQKDSMMAGASGGSEPLTAASLRQIFADVKLGGGSSSSQLDHPV
eukprot:Polyplicarium_translucidae@DN2533_c0_g1_i1.p1